MGSGPPQRLAIDHDGQEFVALFLFGADGRFLDARIDAFGPRETVDPVAIRAAYDGRLRELGDVTFTRIEVEPFALERFGTTFGLVPRPPEDDGDPWWVTLEPGDYMAFTEPWDSGDYDT